MTIRNGVMVVACALCAAAYAPATLKAQDYGKASPGSVQGGSAENDNAMEEARRHAEYEYLRVTYPGGSIPVGARAKAARYAAQNMRLYRPKGPSLQAAQEWRNVGPDNIGGRILTIAVNPKNSRTLFIGAADGGVWRSYDRGATWASVSDDFPMQAMGALAIDPVDTSVVYAGTGEANYGQRMFDGGGIMKSTDGGTTWTAAGGGTIPGYARASALCINPADPRIVYAAIPDGVRDAAQEGIYRSTDAGATWSMILAGRMNDIVIDPAHPSVLYTASSKVFGGGIAPRYGVFKTVDGGDTWSKLDLGLVDSLMGRTSLALCAGDPNVLYAGVSQVTGNDRTWLIGIFKSTDAGASWTKLSVPFDYMVSQGWYDNIVGVNPSNPDIVIAGGVKLITSTDGGATWTRVPDQGFGGIMHVDQHAVAFDPENPDRVFVGNDGGFFIGTDAGRDWVKSDLGLSITQFVGGAMHPTIDAFLLGGTQDNGSLSSVGAPAWTQVLYGDGGNGAINPDRPNVMYTTQETLKLWRSDDYGRTWTRAMGGLPTEQSLFYIEYAMDESRPGTLYLGTYRMYKTVDDGRTWNLTNTCLFPVGNSCYYVSSVFVPRYDGHIVLAGATGGMVAISEDAGTNWRVVSAGLPTAYCSAVRSYTPLTIYATYSAYGVDKVWRSTDEGATWTSLNSNLPDIPVNDIVELDGKLVIGTDAGTYISDDNGATWQRFGTGMPAISVQKLKYNPNTGTLRAMTHGRGMYDLQWTAPAAAPPVFTSLPDTAAIEQGQPFSYAAVSTGTPAANFRLLDAPQGATVDPVLGYVEWNGGTADAQFTLEATNASGRAVQTFTVPVLPRRRADWRVVSATPRPAAVNAVRAPGPATLWIACDSGTVCRTVDGGATWTDVRLPNTTASVYGLHAFDDQRAVVGTRSGRIFKTTDGGSTWRETLFGIDARFGNIWFWGDADGIAVTQGTGDSADVYFTHDGGDTWGRAAQRQYARFPVDNTLTFVDRNLGWYGSSNQLSSPPRDASVLRTTDGGLNWFEIGAGTRNVAGVAFLPTTRGWLVDDLQSRVRRSANDGASWVSTFSYPMNGFRLVAVQTDAASNRVWIVGDTSAWMSSDEGVTWMRTELVPAGPMQTAVFIDSIRGWAVTRTGIVEQYAGPAVAAAGAVPPAPDALRLREAWPNPLRGDDAGTVAFTLGTSARVTVRVYNSAGIPVATLTDAALPPGRFVSVWNPGNAPSGVYFYRVTAGEAAAVQRVVLMR